MSASVAEALAPVHHLISESARPTLTAVLRNPEVATVKAEIGRAIDLARLRCGWTFDDLADHLPAPDGSDRRDPTQVRKWVDGRERAQFDVLFACDEALFVGEFYEQLSPLSRRYLPVTVLRRLE